VRYPVGPTHCHLPKYRSNASHNRATIMKKKTAPVPLKAASEPAQALDAAEITLVLPESQGFEPLTKDFAPTQPVPEPSDPANLPEYRPLEEQDTATLAMPVQDLNPPIALAEPVLAPSIEPAGTVRMAAPTPIPSPQADTGHAWMRWVALAAFLCLAAAGGIAWYVWPSISAAMAKPTAKDGSSSAAAAEAVPPELRPYLDAAKAGDAKAMHMIALMYWNGLNVRQDRVKGLDWYRKAAAAGSTAAQQFLKDNGTQ
jgi:hypothetical protein